MFQFFFSEVVPVRDVPVPIAVVPISPAPIVAVPISPSQAALSAVAPVPFAPIVVAVPIAVASSPLLLWI